MGDGSRVCRIDVPILDLDEVAAIVADARAHALGETGSTAGILVFVMR